MNETEGKKTTIRRYLIAPDWKTCQCNQFGLLSPVKEVNEEFWVQLLETIP